jgi:hypothetical protein
MKNAFMPYLEQERCLYQQAKYIIIQKQCAPDLPVFVPHSIRRLHGLSSPPRPLRCKELQGRRCSTSSTVPQHTYCTACYTIARVDAVRRPSKTKIKPVHLISKSEDESNIWLASLFDLVRSVTAAVTNPEL